MSLNVEKSYNKFVEEHGFDFMDILEHLGKSIEEVNSIEEIKQAIKEMDEARKINKGKSIELLQKDTTEIKELNKDKVYFITVNCADDDYYKLSSRLKDINNLLHKENIKSVFFPIYKGKTDITFTELDEVKDYKEAFDFVKKNFTVLQWRGVEESALSEEGVDKLLLIETPENTTIKIGKYDRKIGKWLVDDAPVTNVTKWMDISELLKVNTKNI